MWISLWIPSSSYRVSLDAHPVIQILAGNIKGNKWVELSAGNLEEFQGAPTHILTANATGVKEQPYDDFQKQVVNIDTRVRFPNVERQVNNTNTPAANYFSLHTAVDGKTPVRWTAKNNRQKVFLQKFLKQQQVLQFDANASGRLRLLADATVSGNTFSFDAVITGTVPPVGQIYDMYSLGRALGEIYVERDELKPKETDFWSDFISTSLDPTETDKRWTVGFTSEASGVPTLANQYDTLIAVEPGTRMLVISPTQFDTSDLDNPNNPPGSLTIGTTDLSDPMFFNYSLDTSGKNYVKFSPTGTPGTLGDPGNGQLLYVVGTVEKHGTIARKSDGGILDDTVAVRDREPSSFFDKLLIPWKAIANFNIANYITSLRQLLVSTSATLSQTTKVLLSDFKTATLAHLSEHIYPQTTKPRDIASTFKTATVNVGNKNGNIAFQNAFLNGVCQMKWALTDDVPLVGGGSIPIADVKKYFTGHHYFEMTNADRSKILRGRVNNFITLSNNTSYFVNLGLYDGEGNLVEPATLTGTFANDESVTIHLSSNLISRNEVRNGAYKENPMTLLGDADQQAFSSTAWTSYSSQTFEVNDLLEICLSPTALGYAQPWCIRFGDVNNTGGQIYNSNGNTFEGRRNGTAYQVRRTAGTGTLHIRIFIKGSNSS